MGHTVNRVYREGGLPQISDDTSASGVHVNSSTGFFEWDDNGTEHTAVDAESAQTISGIKTLTTPELGVATATSINKVTITAPATSATLTLAQGSSLVTSGAYSQTLTATATTSVTLPTAGTLATLAGTETLTGKTLTGNINADTKFCTTQFDATSGTTADTLTNIVGLSTTVVAGTYLFEVRLPGTSTVNSGIKTSFKYTTAALTSLECTAISYSAAALVTEHSTTATDQADLSSNTAAVIYTTLSGRMVVSTGGTVAVQAAQNASHVDTTSVYVGASMTFTRIA